VVTVETHSQTLIHASRSSLVTYCDQCPNEALMLRSDQAAAVFGTTERNLFRLIETGGVHFLEVQGGSVLVCCNSLQGFNDKPVGLLPPSDNT
jgi:hypothetical protein